MVVAGGSRLVDLIRRESKEALHEGRDDDVLRGLDLKDFTELAPNDGVTHTPHLMLLYIW